MANSHRQCAYKPCRKFERVQLGVTTPTGKFFCQAGHAFQWAQDNAQRARAKAQAALRRERVEKVRNFRLNDKSHQLELTRKAFNTMIRLLDAGKRCPTCDDPLIDGQYDAGHVRTVASCPQLRFDARACFGQCRRCNGSGTIRRKTRKTQEVVSELYKAWILETFGQAYCDWLYGPHETRHWTCEELTAMRLNFLAEARRLRSGQEPSQQWRKL